MRAAVDWVKHNSTLLRGFSLDLTIMNSQCDPDVAMADLGSRLARDDKPDLIVGGGCSSVAVPLYKATAAMRIPMVGAGATSGSLSSQPLFVRYTFSADCVGSLAAAVAHFLRLKSIGAVADPLFRTISSHISSPKLGITSCGSLALTSTALDNVQELRRLSRLLLVCSAVHARSPSFARPSRWCSCRWRRTWPPRSSRGSARCGRP